MSKHSDKQIDKTDLPLIGLFRFLAEKNRPWQHKVYSDLDEKNQQSVKDHRNGAETSVPEDIPFVNSNYAPYFWVFKYIRSRVDSFEYARILSLYQAVYRSLQKRNLYRFLSSEKSLPWYCRADGQRVYFRFETEMDRLDYQDYMVGTFPEVKDWIDKQAFLDYPSSAPVECPLRQKVFIENDLSDTRLYFDPTVSLFREVIERCKSRGLTNDRLFCIALFLDTPSPEYSVFVYNLLEYSHLIRSFLEEHDAD